jgi:hypothetical protein
MRIFFFSKVQQIVITKSHKARGKKHKTKNFRVKSWVPDEESPTDSDHQITSSQGQKKNIKLQGQKLPNGEQKIGVREA